MKSVKKRFRMALDEVAKLADELVMLSANISALEPAQNLAVRAKEACYLLSNAARQLDKSGFAAQMREEPALITLDALVDTDVVSEIEERFSATVLASSEESLVEFVYQILAKLEKHLLKLNTSVLRLSEVLNEDDVDNTPC